MSGAGACRDDLDSPNTEHWCDECSGYTHAPWCSGYEQIEQRYSPKTGQSGLVAQPVVSDPWAAVHRIKLRHGRDVKFLGDRLEAQAITMAKLVHERDELREALLNAKRCLERTDRSQLSVRKAIEKAGRALNHAKQGGRGQ